MNEKEEIIETTVVDENVDSSTSTELEEASIDVALTSGQKESIKIQYQLSDDVVQRVINESDHLMQLYLAYKTLDVDADEFNDTSKSIYNTCLEYLVNLKINMFRYAGLSVGGCFERVVLDAIIISRAIRNFIINKSQEENHE